MAGKYSVVILRGATVVKRFKARDLVDAETQFDHHNNMLRWSKLHRDKLGLRQGEDVTLQLFDHREGFELREAMI